MESQTLTIKNSEEPNKIILKNYVVYLLVHSHHSKTYIGMTNNMEHRLRQHNNEIKGGAKYTTRNKGNSNDEKWILYGYIPNLNKHQALSIEKRIQIKSRKIKKEEPVERRLEAIDIILKDVNEKNNSELSFLELWLVNQLSL